MSTDDTPTSSKNTLNSNFSPFPKKQLRFRADFEEVRELGKGAFGRVVMVRHTVDHREYAVKIVSLEADEEHKNRTLREVYCNHQEVGIGVMFQVVFAGITSTRKRTLCRSTIH